MSAIGIFANSLSRPRTFTVSAAADVRHEQLFFERQQSMATRNLEWEGRVQPLLPWSALILRGLCAVLIACLVIAAWS